LKYWRFWISGSRSPSIFKIPAASIDQRSWWSRRGTGFQNSSHAGVAARIVKRPVLVASRRGSTDVTRPRSIVTTYS